MVVPVFIVHWADLPSSPRSFEVFLALLDPMNRTENTAKSTSFKIVVGTILNFLEALWGLSS